MVGLVLLSRHVTLVKGVMEAFVCDGIFDTTKSDILARQRNNKDARKMPSRSLQMQ